MSFADEISFIARFYRPGAFNTLTAWRSMKTVVSFSHRRWSIVAAVTLLVAFSAAAAVLIHRYVADTTVQAPASVPAMPDNAPGKVDGLEKNIDFDNAPLPAVVERIKEVYGVEVAGLPTDAQSYRLTLHYEGNAFELVETINELLDTNLAIEP